MFTIQVNRIGGEFGFEAKDANGHTARLDTSTETGGTDFGARPMQMVLMALGGCSGIDIISILKKQRITPQDFSMTITGYREKDKIPSLWESIHVVFEFTGDIDADKAIRACALSIDKYCSVAETLRRSGTKLTWQMKLNGM